MGTHVLMNVLDSQELRVAVIRDGRLEGLTHERLHDEIQAHGNICKARVANVEPSLNAAFLDLGLGKNGFVHADELTGGKGKRIDQVVRPGEELLVQITKEAIKEKGPCVSSHISLAGRYLVMVASDSALGISKRIEDPAARRRLRGILDSLEAPEGFGFIIRTAGAERSEEDIRLDAFYLRRLWQEIEARATRSKAPAVVYQEADLVLRTLRDHVPPDVEAVIIDQEDIYDEARAFAEVLMPELASRIQLHRDELPLFAYYGVEDRIANILEREVRLPSGGAIVIDQTEALVAIDVNSSRNKESNDVEQTAFMTNMEAVNAIAEQLVLRDLGGLIIIDFIDMEDLDHRRMVQLALRRALLNDKARTQVAPLSRFGLVEMTRQRTKPSHRLVSHVECPHCRGSGQIKTPETFEIDCLRAVRDQLGRQDCSRIEVVVPVEMVAGLLNGRRQELSQLEDRFDTKIIFVGDALMKSRDFRLSSTPRRGGRGRRRDDKPVRASLLAGLPEERERALAEIRDLLKRKPKDIERELEALAEGRRIDPVTPLPAPVASPTVVLVAPQPQVAPSVWDEAFQLRALLFAAPQPQAVAVATTAAGSVPARASSDRSRSQGLANGSSAAKSQPPSGGRRRRQPQRRGR